MATSFAKIHCGKRQHCLKEFFRSNSTHVFFGLYEAIPAAALKEQYLEMLTSSFS
jgi:hypothetical protein